MSDADPQATEDSEVIYDDVPCEDPASPDEGAYKRSLF